MGNHSKKDIGNLGEDYTVNHYINNGYRIIKRNYHSRYGEIDIIACNEEYLVFIEVKTRRHNGLTNPFEAVNLSKQKKITATAQVFLSENQYELQPRFDVAALYTINGRVIEFDIIENAF